MDHPQPEWHFPFTVVYELLVEKWMADDIPRAGYNDIISSRRTVFKIDCFPIDSFNIGSRLDLAMPDGKKKVFIDGGVM